MSNIPSFNDWAETIHHWALGKGWWQDDRNVGEIILLFVREVSELFEEWRDGRSMTKMYFNQEDSRRPIVYENEELPARINKKPEGIPVEMADIFIRILDVCPMWEIDIDEMIRLELEKDAGFALWPGGLTEPPANVGHALMAIVSECGKLSDSWSSGLGLNEIVWRDPEDGRRTTAMVPDAVPYGFPIQLAKILLMLIRLCQEWDIDIMRYIDIKHKYNVTRPYRHGNKKA